MSLTPFDPRKGIPVYGDCCDYEKQYVRLEAHREALNEINRLKLVIAANTVKEIQP